MAFGFTGLVAVVGAARGVHVQWRGSSISVPSIAALGTGSASVVALLTAAATHGVKKATQKWRKARKKALKAQKKALKAQKKALKAQKKALKAQKVGGPSREPQTELVVRHRRVPSNARSDRSRARYRAPDSNSGGTDCG